MICHTQLEACSLRSRRRKSDWDKHQTLLLWATGKINIISKLPKLNSHLGGGDGQAVDEARLE